MQAISEFFWGKELATHPSLNFDDYKGIQSVFTLKELKILWGRYVTICNDMGFLTQSRFMMMPEVCHSQMAKMAFYYETTLTDSEDRKIDFNQFVHILSKLSPLTPNTEKVEYLFDVVEKHTRKEHLGSKYLIKEDIKQLMTFIISTQMNDELIDALVDSVWETLKERVILNESREGKRPNQNGQFMGVSRGQLTAHLCSLDISNFLTVQF